jgi:arylsulfatase A
MILFLAQSKHPLRVIGCRRESQRQLLCRITTLAISACTALFAQTLYIPLLKAESSDRPNIVLILADDLGYGDLQCYNAESRISTPNLNRLASEGMRFTDAHSPCTVCTPTRYSLMTGQMGFRIPNGGRVFSGAGGPSLIQSGRLTLPKLLSNHGYKTACVGKWHIGLTFYDRDGKPIHDGSPAGVQRIDYSRDIDGGPLDCGFDQFFGTACCPTTDWLYAYIDGKRIPVPPTGPLDKSKLPKHPYANDNRAGLIASDFDLQSVDLKFLEKSQAFLKQHVASNPDQPFFLFHSTQAVHLPSFPADGFKGKTQSGPHGDFIFELDHIVGELMKTLESLSIADNTIIIFTSDNGPEVPTVYNMRHDHNHDGAKPWRGVKRDNWEGGHRVPLVVRWPGHVLANTKSDELTSLTDVMATIAEIVDTDLPNDAAEDSFSMLSVLQGKDFQSPIRPYLLVQGFGGQKYLAIRRGRWKYLAHKGSGGNEYATHPQLREFALPDTAPDAKGQLYDLKSDPGETNNLASSQKELAAEMQKLLDDSISQGRSAPNR